MQTFRTIHRTISPVYAVFEGYSGVCISSYYTAHGVWDYATTSTSKKISFVATKPVPLIPCSVGALIAAGITLGTANGNPRGPEEHDHCFKGYSRYFASLYCPLCKSVLRA